jgi:hypothetical protein
MIVNKFLKYLLDLGYKYYRMVVKYQSYITKSKGKAVPLQAWSGPEGSRNLRFPDYMTTAQCYWRADQIWSMQAVFSVRILSESFHTDSVEYDDAMLCRGVQVVFF